MSFPSVTKNLATGLVSEAHPDFDKIASPMQKQAIEAAKLALDQKMTADDAESFLDSGGTVRTEIRAKYKIEVHFGPDRTTAGPNLAGITIWESGKRFHGGGDDLAYWCKDNRQGHDEGCWGPIISDHINNGLAYCPKCKRTVNAEMLTSLRVVKLPTSKLCEVLTDIFRKLDSNCDIYLKFHKTDVRYKAMMQAKGPQAANKLKGMHIYPLKNILKETANGADLAKRFYAFLTS